MCPGLSAFRAELLLALTSLTCMWLHAVSWKTYLHDYQAGLDGGLGSALGSAAEG